MRGSRPLCIYLPSPETGRVSNVWREIQRVVERLWMGGCTFLVDNVTRKLGPLFENSIFVRYRRE